jgi:hypothetical protein
VFVVDIATMTAMVRANVDVGNKVRVVPVAIAMMLMLKKDIDFDIGSSRAK